MSTVKKFLLLLGVCPLALILVLVSTLGMISVCSIASLHLADTELTTEDLSAILNQIRWNREYERGEFDCSNMSALLCQILEEQGFHTRIATTNKHSWVLVKTVEGVLEIEAKERCVTEDEPRPLAVLPLGLAMLIEPTGQYQFSGDEYNINDKANDKAGEYKHELTDNVWSGLVLRAGNATESVAGNTTQGYFVWGEWQ